MNDGNFSKPPYPFLDPTNLHQISNIKIYWMRKHIYPIYFSDTYKIQALFSIKLIVSIHPSKIQKLLIIF
jgi:hypothetical protein